MSLMVDDQVRSINNKLPPDERESAITIIEHSGKHKSAMFLQERKLILKNHIIYFFIKRCK